MLAWLGFVDVAKPSRIFKAKYFERLFSYSPKRDGWERLAGTKPEWGGERWNDLFDPVQPSSSQWLLALFVYEYWRYFTFPESRQLLLAYDEESVQDPHFKGKYWKKGRGWQVPDMTRDKLLEKRDSCYWTEQVAKSAYLVLVYQSMRIFNKAFGPLVSDTCQDILRMKQFSSIVDGESISAIGDFRSGSLSDGPLTAVGKIAHHSCELLWLDNESRIRNMASRQQVFLQEGWVARISDQVDRICSGIDKPKFRMASDLAGPDDDDLGELDLRELITHVGVT